MSNIWLIAAREFRQRVRSRGFIIGSIVWPVFFLVLFAFSGGFSPEETAETAPIEVEIGPQEEQEIFTGYVDQANLIQSEVETPLIAFADTEAANRALRAGKIEAYYIIPRDYIETGEIQRVSQSLPSEPPSTAPISTLLTGSLIEELGVEEPERFVTPFGSTGLKFVSLADDEPVTTGVFSFAPFLVTIFIILPLWTSGDYLVRSVTQEKSSRVMEILLLSLQPKQLLAGKLLGFGALTFVQYSLWILIAVITMLITGQDLGILLAQINLTNVELIYIFFYALGGYILYSAIMGGLGALAPNLQAANSLVFILILPMILPFFFWAAIVEAPHGTLATVLGLFPFSAPLAMVMRLTATTLPLWEIAISLGLLALTSAGIVWLMARFFRVQTLLSGEAISLRRAWSVLKTA